MKKWIVGLKLGIPAILIVAFAVRYLKTGAMSDSSALGLLVSVCSLLSMADDIPRLGNVLYRTESHRLHERIAHRRAFNKP